MNLGYHSSPCKSHNNSFGSVPRHLLLLILRRIQNRCLPSHLRPLLRKKRCSKMWGKRGVKSTAIPSTEKWSNSTLSRNLNQKCFPMRLSTCFAIRIYLHIIGHLRLDALAVYLYPNDSTKGPEDSDFIQCQVHQQRHIHHNYQQSHQRVQVSRILCLTLSYRKYPAFFEDNH